MTGSSDLTLTPRTSVVFSHKVDDADVPVLLPRLSDWLRTDAAEFGTVH